MIGKGDQAMSVVKEALIILLQYALLGAIVWVISIAILTHINTKQQLLECQKHQLSSPAEKTDWLHRLNRNQDYHIDKF